MRHKVCSPSRSHPPSCELPLPKRWWLNKKGFPILFYLFQIDPFWIRDAFQNQKVQLRKFLPVSYCVFICTYVMMLSVFISPLLQVHVIIVRTCFCALLIENRKYLFAERRKCFNPLLLKNPGKSLETHKIKAPGYGWDQKEALISIIFLFE